MSPKDRIKIFIDHKGLTIAAFERECGLGNGFVSKIGDSIRREKLDLISKRFPELNTEWIINEKGSMLTTFNSISVPEPVSLSPTVAELIATIKGQLDIIKSQQETIKNLSETVCHLAGSRNE